TTGLPNECARSITACVSSCCGSMPPVITMSAHSRSAATTSSLLRLSNRTFQSFGSMAASVINPSGGAGQRTPQISHTDAKLQNEFGLKRGKTISTFGRGGFPINSAFECPSVCAPRVDQIVAVRRKAQPDDERRSDWRDAAQSHVRVTLLPTIYQCV